MAYTFRGESEFELGLGLPRFTTTARTAYTPPSAGYKAFDTDLGAEFTWNGTSWIQTAVGDAAQKVEGAVAGNLAALDASGDLTDSGFDATSFATAAQGTLADSAVQLDTATSTLTNNDAFVDITTEQTIAGVKTFSAKPLAPATLDADGATTLTTKQFVLDKITAAAGAGVSTIDDLTDVTITTIATGNTLFWNGTEFANRDVVKADISDFVEGDYATAAQGTTADSATQPGDNISTLTNDAGFLDNTAGDARYYTQTAADAAFATTAQGATADTALQPGDSVGELGDVDITTVAITDGQALVWNNIDGKFVPGSAGAETLDDLTDVDTSTTAPVAAGEALVYDGTGKFVNRALTKSDVSDFSEGDYATAAQGTTADSAVQPGDNTSTLTNDSFVDLTEAQSIAGVKTFTAKPLAPATIDGDSGTTLTTKQFVLDKITAAAGAGVSTFDDLTDVDTSTVAPIEADGIFWDNVNGVWSNRAAVKSDISDFVEADYATAAQGALADSALQDITGETIGDLSDVTITTVATGNSLFWNGTEFANRDIVKGDISDLAEGDYVHTTGDETIAGVKTFSNDAIFNGNLTVNGTTTTVNSTNVDVADNIITLNDGETGAGVTAGSAGIEIDRGTATNQQFVFDETDDSWKVGAVGSTLRTLASTYQETFVVAGWTVGSPNTYVVTQATHGIPYVAGQVYIVQVYDDTGSLTIIETQVNQTTGDVTIKTAGAAFDGRVIISK